MNFSEALTMGHSEETADLVVQPVFREFVEGELLPDLGVSKEKFWDGLRSIVAELTPENRRLLAERDRMQEQIDAWHRNQSGQAWEGTKYRDFLTGIGYLETAGAPFAIGTLNVDAEIATLAGPQLVVPVSNARFALNAANARWGSLYDALYGSNVVERDDELAPGSSYNPARGAVVVALAAEFLDRAVPLATGRHASVVDYSVTADASPMCLSVKLANGEHTALADNTQFIGFAVDGQRRTLLLRNHGLHIEIRIDPSHPVGTQSAAGVCDIELESAITTIQDCEDSVAAIDAEDKVDVYRNWLGLMRGSLVETFAKGDQQITRKLAADRRYTSIDGGPITLPGRSLMLVRNVGHLMTTDAVCDPAGNAVFEGILDTVVTATCALHDLKSAGESRNSRSGSVYIVKPKMHGPAEAAFANTLFARVEDMLDLERNTIKIGVMDEERRTTINLAECIRAVKDRLVFINTGFLDRTGDEIHTSMLAGPVLPKDSIKQQAWIKAYENQNVDVGIRCGLPGKAQIGKGMWPKPDEMKQMLDTKGEHPEAGASCAWVPSPTAATLHAMHYHYVDVAARQAVLASRPAASLDDILTPPLCDATALDKSQIQAEIDNNAQGILGYVVRWIDQGIGCSKVLDIHNVGLMEDRATLRISSQHIANWLRHGVCTREQVLDTMYRMARVVDEQNGADKAYTKMAPDFASNVAFQAACDLVFRGVHQPNGYTEPLLHAHRRRRKEQLGGPGS